MHELFPYGAAKCLCFAASYHNLLDELAFQGFFLCEHSLYAAVFAIKHLLQIFGLVLLEEALDDVLHVRPFILILHIAQQILEVFVGSLVLFHYLNKVFEELLFNTGHSEVDAVLALIHTVKRSSSIQPV